MQMIIQSKKPVMRASLLILSLLAPFTAISSDSTRRSTGVRSARLLPALESAQDPIAITLTLRSSGFDPSDLRLQSGRFLLSVDNRSSNRELVLRLSNSRGEILKEMRITGGGGDWSELFDLRPGDYTLLETSHRDWVCRITISTN
jgi:hypothetical protein